MGNLVRAELVRLRTVRMTGWLVAAVMGMTVMTVLGTVPTKHGPNADISLDDPLLLARCAGVSTAFTAVVALVLGMLTATQELRFGMATSVYLVTPRRTRVLLAKLVAAALGGLVLAVAGLVVALPLGALTIGLRDGSVSWSGHLLQVVLGGFAVMMLYAVLGVAIGSLVRNQIVAIVGGLLWLLVVEALLVQLVPSVGRWSLGGTTWGVLQLDTSSTSGGDLLAPWAAGLLVALYGAAITGLAAVVTPRRDVT